MIPCALSLCSGGSKYPYIVYRLNAVSLTVYMGGVVGMIVGVKKRPPARGDAERIILRSFFRLTENGIRYFRWCSVPDDIGEDGGDYVSGPFERFTIGPIFVENPDNAVFA